MKGIHIEQIICVNTHLQQLMFNQKIMKRNKAKNLLRKKGSEYFEANKRNACEMDLYSLLFRFEAKKNRSETGAP